YAVLEAQGSSPLTGASLAAAIGKLVPPGTTLGVGPQGLAMGASMAAAGQSIDLDGASGTLDFDLTIGSPHGRYAVWCIGLDSSSQPAFAPSGQVFDGATSTLTGTYACP